MCYTYKQKSEPDQDNACVGRLFYCLAVIYRLVIFIFRRGFMSNESQTMKKTNTTLRLTETAIMIAVATVLLELTVIKFPFGGSVTLFGQLPIVLLAYRYGTKWGLLSGAVLGAIQMMFGLNNFSYVTGIMAYLIIIFSDYLVAFGVLGLGGVFKNKIKNQTLAIACGAALASILRLCCHFISGITIWKGYAGSDAIGAIITYALTYNSSYMIPELIITVIGAVAVSKIFDLTSPNLLRKKTSTNA